MKATIIRDINGELALVVKSESDDESTLVDMLIEGWRHSGARISSYGGRVDENRRHFTLRASK